MTAHLPLDHESATPAQDGHPVCRKVVLIDDDRHQRVSGAQTLDLAGFEVDAYADPQLALQQIHRDFEGVLLTDFRMPSMNGLSVLEAARSVDHDLPVVIMTGYGDVQLAVEAMRNGAHDFIEKPFSTELLVTVIGRAMEKRELVLENRRLRLECDNVQQAGVVGLSAPVRRLRARVAEIAAHDIDVCLNAEAGLETEELARAIHDGRGPGRPFVPVNCAELAPNFAELELFGSRGGQRSGGRIAAARGGTLFLNDAGQLSETVRARIDRMRRDGEIGARLIVSRRPPTEPDTGRRYILVAEDAPAWHFVDVPPVRLRGQDRLHLFRAMADRASARFSVSPPELPNTEVERILLHDWPGNLDELAVEAERFVLGRGLSLGSHGDPDGFVSDPLPDRVAAFERTVIEQALRANRGSVKATYIDLGIPRKTLQDKLRKYGLRRQDYV